MLIVFICVGWNKYFYAPGEGHIHAGHVWLRKTPHKAPALPGEAHSLASSECTLTAERKGEWELLVSVFFKKLHIFGLMAKCSRIRARSGPWQVYTFIELGAPRWLRTTPGAVERWSNLSAQARRGPGKAAGNSQTGLRGGTAARAECWGARKNPPDLRAQKWSKGSRPEEFDKGSFKWTNKKSLLLTIEGFFCCYAFSWTHSLWNLTQRSLAGCLQYESTAQAVGKQVCCHTHSQPRPSVATPDDTIWSFSNSISTPWGTACQQTCPSRRDRSPFWPVSAIHLFSLVFYYFSSYTVIICNCPGFPKELHSPWGQALALISSHLLQYYREYQ